MRIDVVVPVFGNWELTRACLESLRGQTLQHNVFVVDDASPDATVTNLAIHFPDVHVIANARNVGFATSCNKGINAGSGDVVVLVNNDVVAQPDMLAELCRPFGSDPQLGSATPLLFRPDGRIDGFGIHVDSTLAGFVRCAGQEMCVVEQTLPELIGPYGAVAAYSRVALNDTGLLDEKIFMYGEELDLALRLNGRGWSTIAIASARGVHLGGASAGLGSRAQRFRAGFGRAFIMRAYGLHKTVHWPRAVLTEALVCAADALVSHDVASMHGRLAGWKAAAAAGPRPKKIPSIDRDLTFIRALRLRAVALKN